jgi:hypothetical protein
MIEESNSTNINQLSERVIRNEDIFCSLLLDYNNRTLRVIDFRGGNFQSKHAYLERVLMTEGMRKIFTLIERDDMNGWQRVGYQREGSIPGYYKRSDAYVMSRIYDADYDFKNAQSEESLENKEFVASAKALGKEFSEQKGSSIRVEQVNEDQAVEIIKEERERLIAKASTAKTSKSKSPKKTNNLDIPEVTDARPIFQQFSRQVEYFYYDVRNKRTKQANLIGAEFQDCFGNTKISVYFSPNSRPERNLVKMGLLTAIDNLVEKGAVSVFSTAKADDLNMNALFASAGFRNTGWLNRQILTENSTVDLVLWTKKLI